MRLMQEPCELLERPERGSISRKRRAESIIDAELHLADALIDIDAGRAQHWIIERHSAIAKIQVIIFELNRPILPHCPLNTSAEGPADARLRGAEGKWVDDRRIRKHTRHGTARDLAVELIRVVCPGGAALGIDHPLAQTTKRVAKPSCRGRDEISFHESEAGGAKRSCDAGQNSCLRTATTT